MRVRKILRILRVSVSLFIHQLRFLSSDRIDIIRYNALTTDNIRNNVDVYYQMSFNAWILLVVKWQNPKYYITVIPAIPNFLYVLCQL